MADLPTEGELVSRADENTQDRCSTKGSRLSRSRRVFTFKVIEVGHAFVGLHAQAVLLASRDALALVTAEQFAALATHEIAHE